MAKLKAKSKAAAAASNVEGASGNDKTIVDPAPSSKPVAEVSKSAVENSAVLDDDKPEEVVDNNKEEEETINGDHDEPEEIEDVEDEEKEPKEVLDVKLEEKIDEVEEAKDGLDDKSEEGEDDEAGDESEEEGEEGDAKEEDGIVESVGTDTVPEGEKVEGEKKVEGEEKVEGEKVVEGEEKVVEAIDAKDNNAKGGATPNKKLKKLRWGKKKTAAASVTAATASGVDGKSHDLADNKQGTEAAGKKELKMADGMGLVFMCNAKTKQDCFRYKVLGLPAGKKELVAKVYKGMRLFLFDIDLKLMYGIYKAATPGGYNIEPKAFKSAFPAQVWFGVLSDCLPLPEEKFKAAIKENYRGKNKFDIQLSQEQVKNLCKLFQKAGKVPKNKNSGEALIAEPELPARGRRNTRKEPERGRANNREVGRARPEHNSSARGRKRTIEAIRVEPGRKRSRHESERGRRDNGMDRYVRREEAYPTSRAGGHHLLHARRGPSPPPSYAYGQQVDEYYYRRDHHLPPPQPLDPRDYRREHHLPPPQPLDPRDYRREQLPPPKPLDPRDYRREQPPPPQALDPRDYHRGVELETRPRQAVEYRDAYGGGMYRDPVLYNEYMAPPASHGAGGYAQQLPAAYAPPSGNLGLAAYAAAQSGNLGTSAHAHAPSSSLYYRY